jgi:hypothetical protein
VAHEVNAYECVSTVISPAPKRFSNKLYAASALIMPQPNVLSGFADKEAVDFNA